MKKRIFSLFLVLALLLGAVPVQAAGGPVIRCSDSTAAQGGWVSFEISAEELQNLAALELWIHYDPQVLRLESVGNGWLLDEAFASVNDTTPGRIALTAASVGGISNSGTLLNLYFSVVEGCAPGRYPLTLAVGEAYDTDRTPVSIAAKNGHITVTEGTPSYSQFRLGMEPERNTLCPGERLTVRVRNDWNLEFASFDLSVYYDASVFRLVNASVSEDFVRPNTLFSLNTDTDGLVRLTCASVDPMWASQLLVLELEAKEGAVGTTALTAQIHDVCDSSRFPYLPGSAQLQLTVTSAEDARTPRLRLEGQGPVIGEKTQSTLVLDAGSGLAAADFELRYDPKLLECLAVEPASDAQFLLINPNFSAGTIRFSFVEETGVTDEIPLVNIRWRAKSGADRHYSIEMQLTDPVDAAFQPVSIDCSPQIGCIYIRQNTDPTCEAPGGEHLCCTACGGLVPVDPIPPLGHNYGDAVFHWAADHTSCTATRVCARDAGHVWQVDCTVTHVSQGESCTGSGSITYTATADFYGETYTNTQIIRMDILGHDYEWTVITEPDCDSKGKKRGKCIRCNATCEESIDPLGHDWDGISCRRCGEIWENPFTDVPEGSFYYAPVIWSVANGITNGVTATTFDPNGSCMRAHVVTFLWRAAGSPEPKTTKNPFVDVEKSSFYYKAVLWAVEKGITNGLDATHFGPLAYCNRAQVVTFLWRANGNPHPTSNRNPFTDVVGNSFYYNAVLWAVGKGITNGMTATSFGVDSICNRAQVVTFLYRSYS